MAIDPRERDHIPVIEAGFSLAPGQQKNIGAITCRQLRKLTATIRASYSQSANVTKPLVIETFWSADGQHYDTNSYASIFLPAVQGATKQISRDIPTPEVGYLAVKVTNPDTHAVSDVNVWMGGRRWADNQTMQV
jgi:hypothetical protein